MAAQALSTLAADTLVRGGVLVQLRAIDTDAAGSGGGLAQSTVALTGDWGLETARANVDGTLVGRAPVAGSRGLLRQRQVGLGLVDLLGLVGVLVDDGLDKS